MAVKKGFRSLCRIGFDEVSIRKRQINTKHMQSHLDANDPDTLTEINLRMARWMGEGDKNLAGSSAGSPHIIFHYGTTASIAMFDPQTLENPFAVCLCFSRVVLSASRIAAMTGIKAPSFGFNGSLLPT